MKRCVIVWGCTSGAGKSLVATALCRWAANRGLDVAPFKAQNMSNNARVVPGSPGDGSDDAGEAGAEIGSAQFFQALAARVPAQVDMNPVLLKPEADTRSQVVLAGRVNARLSRLGWRERSGELADAARAAFVRLAARHEVIVVEGAGSPAETNLAPDDYVNLGTARWAGAAGEGAVRAVLVVDIDRGGAFAHCLGTWSLLPADLRPLLAGYVLNKFRGDAALLAPAPEQLQHATGVPVLGVLPMWREHGLPDEDGLMEAWREGGREDGREGGREGGREDGRESGDDAVAGGGEDARLRIAVVAGPHISNLDEFEPLRRLPGVELFWARAPAALARADWVVLPGSKQVSGDLAWLRAQGLDAAIAAHAAHGRPLLGICGGAQMLGLQLEDPDGIDGEADGSAGPRAGLGLLPLTTRYARPKQVRNTRAVFAALAPPWAALAGTSFEGYEIRCGRSEAREPECTAVVADDGQPIGWARGPVLGVLAHGLFEAPQIQRALFGRLGPTLDERLDGLAAWLEAHLGEANLWRLFAR